MMTEFSTGQIFAWATQLTAQADYQALTHSFLSLLKQIPAVTDAVAYEIYSHDKKRIGEACSVQEQLVRRFPLDFSVDDEKYIALLDEVDFESLINTRQPDGNGRYRMVVLCVADNTGPCRVIVLEGLFSQNCLEVLGNLAALYRNQLILHDRKERDPLTRLSNRQSFITRLTQVMEYYCRYPLVDKARDRGSWMAMLDIDHFKTINDRFGHPTGDEVLCQFSQLMERHFRYNDFLFRFGGEEFIVILNQVNQLDAEITLNRFRAVVEETEFISVGQVTVSIGLTHIDCAIAITQLLKQADQALYHAKASGRNQVVLYEALRQSGI